MPDEPNKHIDELLKAYGKKRREQAGTPSEIHPVTRKMLQSEVARLAPSDLEPERRIGFWIRARPAFVIALFLALLVTVGSVWLRVQTAKPLALAKNETAKTDEGPISKS